MNDWTDGHTAYGCYWRRLDNGIFGYDCRAADDGSDCVCEPELAQERSL
jgi:hypothetical protein